MLGEELLSLIFEKVHYFLECPAPLLREPAGRETLSQASGKESSATT